VPAAEKERRKDFLLSLQQPISRGKLRALRGRTVEAIVEGPSEESEYLLEGRLRTQAPEIDGRLLITDAGTRPPAPGAIVAVRIEKTFDYDVTGTVLG
jgi:ribosomal protein S12 methylthiotransferase